jgi:hypothetical protein
MTTSVPERYRESAGRPQDRPSGQHQIEHNHGRRKSASLAMASSPLPPLRFITGRLQVKCNKTADGIFIFNDQYFYLAVMHRVPHFFLLLFIYYISSSPMEITPE